MDDDDVDAFLDALEAREKRPPFEIVNGAMRSTNGTFWQLPERKFRADGREPLSRDRLNALCDRTSKLLAFVRDGDTLYALACAKSLRATLDLLEHEIVAVARSQGWPWSDIGRVLGVHPSSVHRRYAREEVPRRKRRSSR